jgi:hypothetical protein
MATRWREFSHWTCGTCQGENIIAEREDRLVTDSAAIERSCPRCGTVTPGKVVRPPGTRYWVTTRRELFWAEPR